MVEPASGPWFKFYGCQLITSSIFVSKHKTFLQLRQKIFKHQEDTRSPKYCTGLVLVKLSQLNVNALAAQARIPGFDFSMTVSFLIFTS